MKRKGTHPYAGKIPDRFVRVRRGSDSNRPGQVDAGRPRKKPEGGMVPTGNADIAAERRSIELIKKGDAAEKERFIRANQGLVVYIAKKYAFYPDILPDLVAEGNMGLLKAIEKYDPRRNVKFGTYAYFWIKRFVLRAIMKDFEMLRIPERVQEFREKMDEVRRAYQLEKGRQPNAQELAHALKIPVEIVSKLKRYSDHIRVPRLTDTENGRREDLFEIVDYHRNEEPVISRILQNNDLLERILQQLKSREKRANIDTWLKILKMHFGLDTGVPKSYKEIACELGISRQRVHQIMKICVRRLQEEWKEMENEHTDRKHDQNHT